MKMYALHAEQGADDLNEKYTRYIVCNECEENGDAAFENVDEVFLVEDYDPVYEDRCAVCGKTFEQEVEERRVIRE